jgi:hypothetical protein
VRYRASVNPVTSHALKALVISFLDHGTPAEGCPSDPAMVRYAPEGFAAGIGSLLQPLFAVQPSRSWQSASTLSCTRSKGGGRRGADTGQLDESGAAVRLSDYSVGVLCVPLSSTFSPEALGR